MSRFVSNLLCSGALLLLSAAAGAAEPEHLTIPLSDPAQPARLEVALVQGSITIVAGQPGQVVLVASGRQDEDPEVDRDEPDAEHAGMRRLSKNVFGLDAEEKDNRVSIGAGSWTQSVDLRVEVPAGSSVEASTVNDGEVAVSGLSGELVLHNTNGGISVADVTGPVNASTVNGDVKVAFGPKLALAAMAFSTLNGDIDLTLPAGAGADVVLRSDNGEIYSDFDVALEKRPARVESERKHGKYRVEVSRELTGKIGAGGPELFLKTFNGDIALRQAK